MSQDLKTNHLKNERFYVSIMGAIQFMHVLDFVILMPLAPMLMRSLHISPAEFATLVSAYNISGSLTGIGYGVIADRFERKNLLVAAIIGFIAGTLLCAVANSFNILLIGRLIAGCFGGSLTSMVMALITDLIPLSRRGNAMGVVMSAFSIASIAGVPLGLWIATQWGWEYTFLLIALFGLLFIAPTIFIIPKINNQQAEGDPLNLLKMLGKTLIVKDYRLGYLLVSAISFSAFVIIPFLSPYAVHNIGMSEEELKYIYLVGGAFTIITSRVIGKLTDAKGAFPIFAILAALSLLPIYLYSHADKMPLHFAIMITTLFMTIVSGRFIPCMTMLTDLPSSSDRGRYMALLTSLRSMSMALATLFAGLLITNGPHNELRGMNLAGYFGMGMTIVAIVLAYLVNKKRKGHELNPTA